MEKQKRDRIILIILIPIFLLSLSYRVIRSRAKRPPQDIGTVEPARMAQEKDAEIAEPQGLLTVKYEGSGKDPLKDLLHEYLNKERAAEPHAVKYAAPMPQLRIQGLLWASDMPQAIINGKIVGLGDYIEGVKIVAIQKDGVTVEYGGAPVFIKK